MDRIPPATQPVSYRKAAEIILGVPELKEHFSAKAIIEIAKARGMIREGTGSTLDATLAAVMQDSVNDYARKMQKKIDEGYSYPAESNNPL